MAGAAAAAAINTTRNSLLDILQILAIVYVCRHPNREEFAGLAKALGGPLAP